jgi:phenylpyruvate tautomerase PptA (4-oxalocrotonate tautomerase family)
VSTEPSSPRPPQRPPGGKEARDRRCRAGVADRHQDRFQLIEKYEDDHFIHTDAFLAHVRDLLMIEIALTEGRSDALKKALLADLNRRLVETADVRSDDVVVLIYEFGAANLSLGRGLAHRAP